MIGRGKIKQLKVILAITSLRNSKHPLPLGGRPSMGKTSALGGKMESDDHENLDLRVLNYLRSGF